MDAEILIYISNLIKKNISGEITETELKILNDWINESPRHKQLYDKYSHPNFILAKNRAKDLAEAQIAYQNFKDNLSQKDKLKVFFMNKYVAAASFLAVVVSASFFFLWLSNKQFDSTTINNVAIKSASTTKVSESSDMVLIAADGTRIPITNTQQLMTVSDQSIQVGNQSVLSQQADNNAVSYNTLKILRGKKFKMQLSDGTVVWLNAESEITFPNKFVGSKRLVKVKGELFFDVTENHSMPFVVETPKGNIQVLGTSFNVRCYSDELPATTLVRGKIEYSLGTQSVLLKPGQQCVVRNNELKVHNVDTDEYTSWVNELIVFKNKRLEQIMTSLSRLYDVQITYDDERLKELPFTGAFKQYEHLEDVIQMIEDCGLITIDKNGNHLLIHKRSNTLVN